MSESEILPFAVAVTMYKLGSKQTLKRDIQSTELDAALVFKSKKPPNSTIPPKDVKKANCDTGLPGTTLYSDF